MNKHDITALNPGITPLTEETRLALEAELDRDIAAAQARVAALPDKTGLTALYGSSSIRLWKTSCLDLAPRKVINLGFGGASFDYGVAYFDRAFHDITPNHVVLYFGDNDLARGQSPEEALSHMRKLIDMVEARYPGVMISTISVKPSPIRTPLMALANRLNTMIKAEMDASPRRRYIDIVGYFLDDEGLPEPSLYVDDQLHFNEKGYKAWGDTLHDALLIEA